jgi:ORF6N domain-containing protein
MSKKLTNAIEDQEIIDCIRVIRGQKVMLDSDLAKMYGVPTKVLNQAMKRNITRFPPDFMFQLTVEEFKILKSQFATSSSEDGKIGRGGIRKMPYAFTEQGVAMLSSVLNSEIAIQVNIQIIRVYTRLRQFLLNNLNNEEIRNKIESIEKNLIKKDDEIQTIFKILKELLVQEEPAPAREPIGFKIPKK